MVKLLEQLSLSFLFLFFKLFVFFFLFVLRYNFDLKKLNLKQNLQTLHNRINELGVAEPIIQQQGLDRIVVQLPGVQDTAKAKEILGRTATLEIRLVDEDKTDIASLESAQKGNAPYGDDLFKDRDGRPILVKKNV